MITGLFHTGMTVSDLERSVAFYRQTLGIGRFHTQVGDQPYLADVTGLPGCSLRIGFGQVEDDSTVVEMLQYEHPKGQRAGVRFGAVGAPHVSWEVDSLTATAERLHATGVELLATPHVIGEGPWGGDLAAFLLDPDGQLIELVEPTGQRGSTGRLTRMSHTGFIVRDLEVSLAFLHDRLGLAVLDRFKGESDYVRHVGELQDAFVNAAWLSVPDSGYTLELWELRSPRLPPASMFPANVGSNHFCFLVDDIWSMYQEMKREGVQFAGPPATSTAGINKGGQAIYFVGPDEIRYEFFQGPPTKLA